MHMIVRDKALSQTFCTKTYTLVYKLSKPCDQLPFACLKARYRAWLANRKLQDQQTNEEQAVKKAVEIFKNISTDLIKASWKMTGFKKFEHFEEASDPEVSSQDIQNELNERLELACTITEA